MTSAVGAPENSTHANRRPREQSWARLFGYDIFISFALGPPPRGARAYASDLARCLRERGFTVFFSEDEAPAGGELDDTLKRALGASRVLVLVANRGTLREPRWVRAEVEEFRRRHPRRAVVPISIDGALRDAELSAATQAWLPFADRIWIDETREAGETGSVSEEVIDRLVTAPRAVRSATRLRAVVGAIIAFFAVLAAVALWQRQAALTNAAEAERQRGEAQTQAHRADASASQARAAASAAEAAREEERVARIAEREQRVLAEKRQRLAQSRELAVSATAALAAGDPERAVLLAAAGVELSPSVESRSALRAALLEPRSRRIERGIVGAAWGVAYTPDGRHLVSVGDQGAVVTDLATGRSAPALKGRRLRTVSLSADGRYAVSADEAGRSHLWHVDGDTALAATSAERRIALSPDARLALHFGNGPCARLQAMVVGVRPIDLCGHTGGPHSAAFSPNGEWLLTSSADDVVRVWDTASAHVVQELKAPAAGARVKFSPDGRLAAAIAPVSSTVQLWDTRTWAPRKPARPEFSLLDAVFTPDGERMVLLDALGFQAQMFSTRDGSSSASFVGHTGRIFDAAFSPDGELLVTASEDKTARVWRSWGGSMVTVLRGHADIVTSARFSPDGRRIASSSLDGSSRIWESMKFTDMTELNRQGPRIERTSLDRGEREFWFVDRAHQATVLSVAERALRPLATVPRDLHDLSLSRDGRLFATSEYNGSMRLSRRADGSTVAEWPHIHEYAPKLAFSPDSRRLLSVGGAALWWDLQGQTPAMALKVEAPPSGATFSPDGRHLITIEGSAAILREGRRGAPVARMPSRPDFAVTSARFSSDGQHIVTTSVDRMVRLWRTGSSTPLRELSGHTDAVLDAWFSADGQSVVSVAQDRTARVWDVAAGHSLAELRGSSDNWNSASFHPSGELVLTSGGHNAAAMWDARTGALLISFPGAAAFTEDGGHIVNLRDGRATLYRCHECGRTHELLGLARARAERGLSLEERRIFLHEKPAIAKPALAVRGRRAG